jgi:hypothetical protein
VRGGEQREDKERCGNGSRNPNGRREEKTFPPITIAA